MRSSPSCSWDATSPRRATRSWHPWWVARGLAFALVKIGLTAGGVLLLTQLARLRVFGRIPVGVFLYAVLGLYAVLICYEIGLLNAP